MASASSPAPPLPSSSACTPPVFRGRYRLLALDIDGTVTNSRHEVAESTRSAIGHLRAAGIRVMLATGRRYRDALPIAERLGLDTPMVTASGALVKSPQGHVTLERARFASGQLEPLLQMLVNAGHEPIVHADSFAEGFDFYCRSLVRSESPADGLTVYLARNAALARVQSDLHRSPPDGIFAAFTMGPQEAMRRLESALRETFADGLSLHTLRSPRYDDWLCEIAPAGVTKWTGVAAVARQWGIAAHEICAAGDDVNDLPMIRSAGLGVAMGNARPEVLAAADRVVGTNDGGGISDIAALLLADLAQAAPLDDGPSPAS